MGGRWRSESLESHGSGSYKSEDSAARTERWSGGSSKADSDKARDSKNNEWEDVKENEKEYTPEEEAALRARYRAAIDAAIVRAEKNYYRGLRSFNPRADEPEYVGNFINPKEGHDLEVEARRQSAEGVDPAWKIEMPWKVNKGKGKFKEPRGDESPSWDPEVSVSLSMLDQELALARDNMLNTKQPLPAASITEDDVLYREKINRIRHAKLSELIQPVIDTPVPEHEIHELTQTELVNSPLRHNGEGWLRRDPLHIPPPQPPSTEELVYSKTAPEFPDDYVLPWNIVEDQAVFSKRASGLMTEEEARLSFVRLKEVIADTKLEETGIPSHVNPFASLFGRVKRLPKADEVGDKYPRSEARRFEMHERIRTALITEMRKRKPLKSGNVPRLAARVAREMLWEVFEGEKQIARKENLDFEYGMVGSEVGVYEEIDDRQFGMAYLVEWLERCEEAARHWKTGERDTFKCWQGRHGDKSSDRAETDQTEETVQIWMDKIESLEFPNEAEGAEVSEQSGEEIVGQQVPENEGAKEKEEPELTKGDDAATPASLPSVMSAGKAAALRRLNSESSNNRAMRRVHGPHKEIVHRPDTTPVAPDAGTRVSSNETVIYRGRFSPDPSERPSPDVEEGGWI